MFYFVIQIWYFETWLPGKILFQIKHFELRTFAKQRLETLLQRIISSARVRIPGRYLDCADHHRGGTVIGVSVWGGGQTSPRLPPTVHRQKWSFHTAAMFIPTRTNQGCQGKSVKCELTMY